MYRSTLANAISQPLVAVVLAFQANEEFHGRGLGGPGGVMCAVLGATAAVLGALSIRKTAYMRRTLNFQHDDPE